MFNYLNMVDKLNDISFEERSHSMEKRKSSYELNYKLNKQSQKKADLLTYPEYHEELRKNNLIKNNR